MIASGTLSFDNILNIYFGDEGIMTVSPKGMAFYFINRHLGNLI